MKTIKSFVPFVLSLAAVLAIVFSCGTRNPLYQAVEQKVIDSNPTLKSFYITKLTQESPVTLADELNRRHSLFVSKEKVYAKAALKYQEKGMTNNYNKNEAERKAASEILERIDAYKANHEAQMDSVIYFVYRMSGYGYTYDKSKVQADNNYVTISPEGTVYSIKAANGNPYAGMGIAIPGYITEIIRTAEIEDVE